MSDDRLVDEYELNIVKSQIRGLRRKREDQLICELFFNKGLSDGCFVTFCVENQISGGYCGPTQGKLILSEEDSPYILCKHINSEKEFKMTINKGYDAYAGTIKKINESEAENIELRDKLIKRGYDNVSCIEDLLQKCDI
jgi:hypothetical protein